MMLMISSERMAIADLLEGARDELAAQPLETAADAAIDEPVADADDDRRRAGSGRSRRPARPFGRSSARAVAVSALTSDGSSGGALVATAWTMPLRSSSRRRNSAATRVRCSIRPRRTMNRMRFRTGLLSVAPRPFRSASSRMADRHGRVVREPRRWPDRRSRRPASSSSRRQASTVPSRTAISKAASA